MRTPLLVSASLSLLLATACGDKAPADTAATTAAATPAEDGAPAPEVIFAAPELDQMVAPIALYPDPLLAQVLMAATYPGDVAEAAAWCKANPDATGDAAVRSVQDKPWDPSVQALVGFPQALSPMGADPRWVQRLGDAFLAQPDDVMDAVQRLRRQASASGNLASNDYMTVSTQPAEPAPADSSGGSAYSDGGDTTIIIEPAQPDVVYVPSYDPGVVYGTWAYPAYPPYYYPPPAYYYPAGGALWAGLAFGAGIAIADGLWGDMDWNDNDIDIDIDRYNNINIDNRIERGNGGDRWHHEPRNRDGVPYRDSANRDNFGQRMEGGAGRDGFRGDDAGRAQARDNARNSLERRGVDAPARTPAEARSRGAEARAEQPRMDPGNRAGDRPGAGRDRPSAQPAEVGRGDRAGDRSASGLDRQPANAGRGDMGNRGGGMGNGGRQPSEINRGHSSRSNDAFRGAGNPQASRAQSSRGNQSYGGSQRSGGSRSSGAPAHRSAPSRSGSGGGRRR